MSKEYTEEQLEEAKQYLRDRLEAELSMAHDIDAILEEYMPILVGMLMDGADRDELEEIVKEIVARILDDLYILGVDERQDRKDEIIAYMNLKREGKGVEDRVTERCDTFVDELIAAVIAGSILDLNEQSIMSSIRANYDDPYNNEIIKAARTKIERGEVDFDEDVFEEPHLGRGNDVSSRKALKAIGEYSIADAWMWDLFQRNREKKGYYVFRGSSFPCDICSEAVRMGFHPIADTDHLVPLHPHCKCYIVFV